MAIGQSNMFSAPGSQGLGGNQQLAGVAQPTGSSDMLNPSLPLGQSFNQMQQSQMQMPQFGGIGSLAPERGFGIPPSFQPPMDGIGGPLGSPPGGFPTPPDMRFTPPWERPGIGGNPGGPPPVAPDMRFTPPWERPGFQPPGIGGPPSFQPPGIGMPPGGIGGMPPGFRPPGIGMPPGFRPPGIGMPPGFRPPGFPPGMGIPPGMGMGRPGGLRGIGGIGNIPPAGLIGNLPMFGNTPMPAVTDEVG